MKDLTNECFCLHNSIIKIITCCHYTKMYTSEVLIEHQYIQCTCTCEYIYRQCDKLTDILIVRRKTRQIQKKKKVFIKTGENTWWYLRAHSRTLSRRHWLNSLWRVCASSYHIESEPKQQSWPYISVGGPRTYLGTLAPCLSFPHRWKRDTTHYILVLTFCISLSSAPASDQNPISVCQPETSESHGSCHNFSQRTKTLIIQYVISPKPWVLRDIFWGGINTSFIDCICGAQKVILACSSVKDKKKQTCWR